MSIKLVEVIRSKPIAAELVVLGWGQHAQDDLELIEADISKYVAVAKAQGFSLADMLQDILDKYKSFFIPCGDVDTIQHADRDVVLFYLRARAAR